jgi:hypothetical protein
MLYHQNSFGSSSHFSPDRNNGSLPILSSSQDMVKNSNSYPYQAYQIVYIPNHTTMNESYQVSLNSPLVSEVNFEENGFFHANAAEEYSYSLLNQSTIFPKLNNSNTTDYIPNESYHNDQMTSPHQRGYPSSGNNSPSYSYDNTEVFPQSHPNATNAQHFNSQWQSASQQYPESPHLQQAFSPHRNDVAQGFENQRRRDAPPPEQSFSLSGSKASGGVRSFSRIHTLSTSQPNISALSPKSPVRNGRSASPIPKNEFFNAETFVGYNSYQIPSASPMSPAYRTEPHNDMKFSDVNGRRLVTNRAKDTSRPLSRSMDEVLAQRNRSRQNLLSTSPNTRGNGRMPATVSTHR